MNVWFTSDTHLGHGNIIKYCNRPYLTQADKVELERNGGTWKNSKWRITPEAIKMMDEALIENINAHVKNTDELWHLGDVLFSKHDHISGCKHFLNRLNCKKVFLIYGNHDHRQIGSLFVKAFDQFYHRFGKYGFHLDHYAHAVWPDMSRNSVHLYAHSHSNAEETLDKLMPGRRSMDVGVDNALKILGVMRPFSLDEIMDIMKDRPGFSIDHHEN